MAGSESKARLDFGYLIIINHIALFRREHVIRNGDTCVCLRFDKQLRLNKYYIEKTILLSL